MLISPRKIAPRFIEIVLGLSATWISFEGLGLLPDIDARLMKESEPDSRAFVLARDGEPVSLASPHGRWVRCVAR
jgi:hypothetical protein